MTDGHYKVYCSECNKLIRGCRCPDGEITYEVCDDCKKLKAEIKQGDGCDDIPYQVG